MVIPSVCDECSFLFDIITHCHPILISIVLFTLFYHSSLFFFFSLFGTLLALYSVDLYVIFWESLLM